MGKKELLRSVLFAGILVVVLWMLSSLFNFRDLQWANRFTTFQNLEKNTVDAVLVGTSGMDRYWINSKAYEEHGITLFSMSSDQQPSWMMKHILKEVEKRQDIRLAVIDMRPFIGDYKGSTEHQETSARRVLDELPFFSLNRLEAVKTTIEALQETDPEGEHHALSFYLPFVKFHSQWEDQSFLLDENDEKFQPYLGFFIRDTVSTKGLSEFPVTVKTDEKAALEPVREKALYDLLEYLAKQDYEVLFVDTPHYITEEEYARMNTLCDILDENGFKYKRYDVEDGTFNLRAEFYNNGHVNYWGAERFTELFSQYLKENYNLPDRREDSRCSKVWNGPYDAVKEQIAQMLVYKKMNRPAISVESLDDGAIKISWNAQSVANGYEIYRNTSEGGRYEVLQQIKGSETAEFTDTTAEPGTEYYYMVRAYRNINGTMEFSRYSEAVNIQ